MALDGDDDRMGAVAADGSILDGDQVIAVCAIDRHQRAELPDDTVVLPGHMQETRIGQERQTNPFVLEERSRRKAE